MTPLRVLIVTDAFPPRCGGSGWSTWELTRGLVGRGHHVEVVRIEPGADTGVSEEAYDGVPVTRLRRYSPTTPLVRNVAKNERLWRDVTAWLTSRLARAPADVVHGQHVMSGVPAIRAAAAAGVASVVTVRDYWPVCFWSDLIYDPSASDLCPRCTPAMMARCVRPRSGALWPAALGAIPYMRANLAAKRRALSRAGAIVAVSSAIARDLEARAPEIAATPMYTVPNPVDMRALDDVAARAPRPLEGPYVLYAGKLATNKGVQWLVPAVAAAGLDWPLVVVGDGPMRAAVEADAARLGVDLRITGWIDRAAALAWMRHAAILAFPSYGPESLSRVLIEAAGLGVPIAAMETGGTRDILKPGETALLSHTPEDLARDLGRLRRDDTLRAALGRAAHDDVRLRFDTATVASEIEQVYRALLPLEAA